MILIALAVRLDSKGPIIFRQQRLGLHGEEFTFYKFRSMCEGAEGMGSGVYSDDSDFRVTRVGKILRATSLDELPQIFNILKGDMSFIGPRPPLTYHPYPIEQYSDMEKRIFEVRPGITGWAQVNGRRTVEWDKRFEMNVWYVDHVSALLDLKVFFLTIFKVLKNDDNENLGETVVKAE